MNRAQRRVVARQQGRVQRPAVPVTNSRSAATQTASVASPLDALIRDAFALAQQQQASGQIEDARALYLKILEAQPTHEEAILHLAQIAEQSGDREGACALLQRGAIMHPDSWKMLNEYARVLWQLQRLDDVIEIFRRVAELQPDAPIVWHNLGGALYQELDFAGARQAYERAITLAPEYASAHHGLGLASVMLGDLARGLGEIEWRWKMPGYAPDDAQFARTFWDGSPLDGRTIFVHDEQGFGDTLQYVRYLPQIKALGGKVILRCQPPLGRLLAGQADLMGTDGTGSNGAERVLGILRNQPVPPYDVHAPLMSLPHMLGTTLETVPANVPYLHPLPEDSAKWSSRLAADTGLKIGLVWAGSPLHTNDKQRSLTLDTLAPLGQVRLGGRTETGVTFYSLQKGPAAEAANHPPAGMALVNLDPELGDFADTAAAVSRLDLVITVDTAVGHLAGALGKPVWVLLSAAHDSRWMTEREDTPWYPGHRLFRQRCGEGWPVVMARVAAALEEFGRA